MAEDNGKNEKKRPLSRAEKFKNYGIGIGAMSALLLGIWANVKGEPTAEKTWATLRDRTNDLTEMVNKLSKQVIFLQAHENGRTAAQLMLKLEAAEAKLAKLGAVPGALVTKKPPTPTAPTVMSKPQKKCKTGYVLADDRCRRVHKAVAKKMAKDEAEKAEAQRRLLEEKRKRLAAERRKRELMKQMTIPKPAPAPLPKLPLKLDEAGK